MSHSVPEDDKGWSQLIEKVQQTIDADTEGFPSTINFAREDTRSLAKTIDHTLLKLDATEDQIDKLCEEAKTYGFKTVCVRLPWVKRARANLSGSSTEVCVVIGFHEGTYSAAEKSKETEEALEAGAQELDFVINYENLHKKAYKAICNDELIPLTTKLSRQQTSKLILEISQLTSEEIVAATVLAFFAGFSFVKTSTGFNGHGATVDAVNLMRRTCHVLNSAFGRALGSTRMKVKASGGIRTWADSWAMLEAGAERLGVSAGVAIVEGAGKEEKSDGKGY